MKNNRYNDDNNDENNYYDDIFNHSGNTNLNIHRILSNSIINSPGYDDDDDDSQNFKSSRRIIRKSKSENNRKQTKSKEYNSNKSKNNDYYSFINYNNSNNTNLPYTNPNDNMIPEEQMIPNNDNNSRTNSMENGDLQEYYDEKGDDYDYYDDPNNMNIIPLDDSYEHLYHSKKHCDRLSNTSGVIYDDNMNGSYSYNGSFLSSNKSHPGYNDNGRKHSYDSNYIIEEYPSFNDVNNKYSIVHNKSNYDFYINNPPQKIDPYYYSNNINDSYFDDFTDPAKGNVNIDPESQYYYDGNSNLYGNKHNNQDITNINSEDEIYDELTNEQLNQKINNYNNVDHQYALTPIIQVKINIYTDIYIYKIIYFYFFLFFFFLSYFILFFILFYYIYILYNRYKYNIASNNQYY